MGERDLAVVLAAGEGTRMRSRLPKVLHPVGGLPMVAHVLASVAAAGIARTALVVGSGGEAVAEAARRVTPEAAVFVQAERLGTAHAVLAAREAIAGGTASVVVLYGDTPLVTPATIRAMADRARAAPGVAVLGFRPADPAGYGRILAEGDRVAAIREEREASAAERAVTLCNSGIMALSGAEALSLLEAISNDNAKGEYYLTDAVEIAVGRGLAASLALAAEEEVTGVNDRVQLAAAEGVFQRRAREAAMRAGATLEAPETVHFCHDTVLEEDVRVEPNVVFGPQVVVRRGAVVRAFSHLEGAEVAEGAVVGPFARLRPKSRIGEKARVGNFVEIKNADLGEGAKANHLAYVGDATVGAGANLGAGTITCNYDGRAKHPTQIGAGAFVGSNSALVAPVSIGRNALVAAGSTIVEDVPDGALALARGRQATKPGRSPFSGGEDGDGGSGRNTP